MVALSHDFSVYLFFLQSRVDQTLAQVLEEAVIFVYEDSMQGNTGRHLALVQFLDIALEFIELAISKHFSEHFPNVKTCLQRIWSRLQTLLQKKDNPILNHFMHGLINDPDESTLQQSEEMVVLNQL